MSKSDEIKQLEAKLRETEAEARAAFDRLETARQALLLDDAVRIIKELGKTCSVVCLQNLVAELTEKLKRRK